MGKAKTKIAPASARFLFLARIGFGVRLSQAHVAALAREVRALLAVARAAEGVRRYVLESGYEDLEGPADAALFRALARLSRSSSPRAARARR